MEKENTPLSSHPKLSLSLKRQFAALEAVFFSEGVQMYGAEQRAVSNFEEWQRDYNRRNPSSEIRRDILGSMECQELDEVLSTLIVKA